MQRFIFTLFCIRFFAACCTFRYFLLVQITTYHPCFFQCNADSNKFYFWYYWRSVFVGKRYCRNSLALSFALLGIQMRDLLFTHLVSALLTTFNWCWMWIVQKSFLMLTYIVLCCFRRVNIGPEFQADVPSAVGKWLVKDPLGYFVAIWGVWKDLFSSWYIIDNFASVVK